MKDRYGFDFLDRTLSTDQPTAIGSARIARVDAVFSVGKLSLDQQSPAMSMAQAL